MVEHVMISSLIVSTSLANEVRVNMINLSEWIMDLSRNYSIQHIDDVENGVFVAPVTNEVYLVKHAEVKK